MKVPRNAGLCVGNRYASDYRLERITVSLGEDQLEVPITFLIHVDQVALTNLLRREPVKWFALIVRKGLQVLSECREQDRDSRESLLAVDDEIGLRRRRGALILFDVDNGPREVIGKICAFAGAKDIVPELSALGLTPGLDTLIDRDDELSTLFEQFKEVRVNCFHCSSFFRLLIIS